VSEVKTEPPKRQWSQAFDKAPTHRVFHAFIKLVKVHCEVKFMDVCSGEQTRVSIFGFCTCVFVFVFFTVSQASFITLVVAVIFLPLLLLFVLFFVTANQATFNAEL